MTMSRNAPTFEFADDAPVKTGRKHRRGRGYMPNRKGNTSAQSKGSGAASQNDSYGQGSGHSSSASSAINAHSMSAQMGGSADQAHPNHPQTQATYYTASDFDAPNASNRGSNANDADHNSCAGSLTYSASSSVQSAESSQDSSFGDILKHVDSEGEGASEIKEFMAKQSKAASGDNTREGSGSSHGSSAAVQGWIQRVEDRSRKQMQQAKQQQQKKKQQQQQQQQYTMASAKNPPSGHVDLNYSKDDSSEDDVFGVEFDETELETIAGLKRGEEGSDTEAKPQADPFPKHQDPFRHPFNTSPSGSAPSSPSRNSAGHVTPPPNSRSHKRTSTPPGSSSISRTNSRHSKSSSDGSFDTPAPASPPGGAGITHPMTKPPHHMSRSTPVGKARRKNGKDEKAVQDLSEAFYAKSWMCGFTDAFNFDGFDQFQK